MEYALVYTIYSVTASLLKKVLRVLVLESSHTSIANEQRAFSFPFGRELLMADAGRSAGGLNRVNPS
jgi:hypothetical protein